MMFSWLHSVSSFLALLALWAGFWITLRIYRWYKNGKKRNLAYSKLIAEASDESWTRRSTPIHTTIVDHWPVILVSLSSFLLGHYVGGMRSELKHQAFDEMNDVQIVERKDAFTFRMQVEDPDTHKPRLFGVRFCPDYEPTHEMQPGVKLDYLKFQRHDFDDCWEIAPENLGYGLRRDEHGKPILFSTR